MMYSGLPARNRRQIQAVLGASWLLVAGVGASIWLPPPNPLEEILGDVAAFISGLVLVVAACVAAGGVLARQYRWEWVSSWIAGAALVPYAITAWYLTWFVDGLYSTSAFLSTGMLGFMATRALLCAAHAAKLREVHTTTTTVIDAISEGDEGGDATRTGG
jgi:hypothetical protein